MTLRVTLVRTSCLLLEHAGLRLLTDPWFGATMRGLPVYRAPGIPLRELGRLDAVVASHLHRDHFDLAAVAHLAHPGLEVFGTRGTARHCRSIAGLRVTELAPWEEARRGPLELLATPALHTGPPPAEVNFLIRLGPWRVFFGGDTRLHPALPEIAACVPEIHVALLPVGGTLIFGRRTTMDPADAVEACRALRPRWAVPIHEGGEWKSIPPLSQHPGRFTDFAARLRASGLPSVPRVLRPGHPSTFTLGAAP